LLGRCAGGRIPRALFKQSFPLSSCCTRRHQLHLASSPSWDWQDLLAAAEETKFEELKKEGQTYYSWDIDGPTGHALISVTSARNKLYAHFVNAKPAEWSK